MSGGGERLARAPVPAAWLVDNGAGDQISTRAAAPAPKRRRWQGPSVVGATTTAAVAAARTAPPALPPPALADFFWRQDRRRAGVRPTVPLASLSSGGLVDGGGGGSTLADASPGQKRQPRQQEQQQQQEQRRQGGGGSEETAPAAHQQQPPPLPPSILPVAARHHGTPQRYVWDGRRIVAVSTSLLEHHNQQQQQQRQQEQQQQQQLRAPSGGAGSSGGSISINAAAAASSSSSPRRSSSQALDLDAFSLLARLRDAAQRAAVGLRGAFAPAPEDVSPDYWEWLRWRLSQRLFSSTLQNFATQSLLVAVGVGARRSLAAGAVINWMLKDGVSRLVRMGVATSFGASFDSDLKRFRFATSLVFSACVSCEFAAPFFPQHFLALASVSNVGRAVGLTTFVSSQPAFMQALSNGGNLADLSAKTQAQHMAVDTVALALAAGLNWALRSNERARALLPVVAFPLLSAADLYCIYRELKAVELRTINRERAEMIAARWLELRDGDGGGLGAGGGLCGGGGDGDVGSGRAGGEEAGARRRQWWWGRSSSSPSPSPSIPAAAVGNGGGKEEQGGAAGGGERAAPATAPPASSSPAPPSPVPTRREVSDAESLLGPPNIADGFLPMRILPLEQVVETPADLYALLDAYGQAQQPQPGEKGRRGGGGRWRRGGNGGNGGGGGGGGGRSGRAGGGAQHLLALKPGDGAASGPSSASPVAALAGALRRRLPPALGGGGGGGGRPPHVAVALAEAAAPRDVLRAVLEAGRLRRALAREAGLELPPGVGLRRASSLEGVDGSSSSGGSSRSGGGGGGGGGNSSANEAARARAERAVSALCSAPAGSAAAGRLARLRAEARRAAGADVDAFVRDLERGGWQVRPLLLSTGERRGYRLL